MMHILNLAPESIDGMKKIFKRIAPFTILLAVSLTGCAEMKRIFWPDAPPGSPPKLENALLLNTGGHTGFVNDLLATSDGKLLVSAGEDKTIRVWSAEGEKKEVRKILGHVGEDFGEIYSIALSPDNQRLAVGARMPPCCKGIINIFDFPTGEFVRRLKSDGDAVYDLTFSEDGRYLVSGAADWVSVWDVEENFELTASHAHHKGVVNAVGVFPHEGDLRVVSAGSDRRILLFSLNQKKIIGQFSNSDDASSLAISKKLIVGSDKGSIHVFNLDLRRIKTIKSAHDPIGLAFSPNGRFLLVGSRSSYDSDSGYCNIYDFENNQEHARSRKVSGAHVKAVTFIDDAAAAFPGRNNMDILFWNFNEDEATSTNSHGDAVRSLGVLGNRILCGRNVFNMETLGVEKPSNLTLFKSISQTYMNYSLSRGDEGQEGLGKTLLNILKNGRVVQSIQRDQENGFYLNVYGFTPDGSILAGGGDGQLKAFSLTAGKSRASSATREAFEPSRSTEIGFSPGATIRW